MGTWSVITPETTTNLFLDPQIALPDPDQAAGGEWTIADDATVPDVVRSTAQQLYGTGSALFDIDDGTYVSIFQAITVTATSYTLSCLVRRAAGGAVSATQARAYFNSGAVDFDSYTLVRDGWYRCIRTGIPAAAARDFGVIILEDAAWVDGMQLENKAYRTTYCDGTQLGCEWDLGPHTSTSTRSAIETRGGVKVDLEDYELYVRDSLGAGMAPVQNILARHGQQPGAVFQRQNILPRTFTLVGAVVGTGRANLHSWRESIIDALKIDRSPTGLPTRLWYDNGTNEVYIDCRYDAGMDLGRTIGTGAERVAVRLVADDPFFYHEGDISELLDTRDIDALRYVAGRLRDQGGLWYDLGRAVNPAVGGIVYAIKYNPHDGLVYVGGNFTDFFNDATGADYAVVYDPQADTWARLGGAGDVSAIVLAIAISPNGDVYFGGDFVALGGVGGDYVAYWDISAGVWAILAANGTMGVQALEFGLDGTLYIGGDFANWNALGANNAVKYPVGGPYTVMDAGNELNNDVQVIKVHPTGEVYFGGIFTQFGANVCNYWCRYDLTDYQIVDIGLNNTVWAMTISEDGTVYLGGGFTDAGDANGDYITKWDGQQFISLGTGMDAIVYSLHIAPDGMLYAGGIFTLAGNITVADRTAKWNGYTWAHLDVDLFGAPIVWAIETCRQDPVVRQNYDLYIGHSTTGNAEIAGLTAITNDGGRNAYPHTIQITANAAAAGGVIIEQLRNETTGREILFDYVMLAGEVVTLHLEPNNRYMESSMFGRRWSTLPASDVADWYLMPGANNVTMFIPTGGVGSTETFLLYRRTEWSVDE